MEYPKHRTAKLVALCWAGGAALVIGILMKPDPYTVMLLLGAVASLLFMSIGIGATVRYTFGVLDRKVGRSLKVHEAGMDGFLEFTLVYPSIGRVNTASRFQLAAWARFLPSPENTEQQTTLSVILDRFTASGGWTTEISKRVGWDLLRLLNSSQTCSPSTSHRD